jgi:hypothetical protein
MTKKQIEKKAFRVGKLNTIQDVNCELAKLYRRSVHNHIDSADAARQSSILANLRQGMEQGIIELRLSNIEETILRLAANRSAPVLLNGHTVESDDESHETIGSGREGSCSAPAA